jgi:hypothetical protein
MPQEMGLGAMIIMGLMLYVLETRNNMFTVTPFTDKNILIDDNITRQEKVLMFGGWRWWPINDEFMDRYIEVANLEGGTLFNLEFNGEIVGHFSIWLDSKCEEGTVRLTRGYILKAYRNRIHMGKPWAYWLADTAIKKAKEMFPDKTPYIVVYDTSMHKSEVVKGKPLGLSSYELAGFKEYKREDKMDYDGNQIATKIWLKYKG